MPQIEVKDALFVLATSLKIPACAGMTIVSRDDGNEHGNDHGTRE